MIDLRGEQKYIARAELLGKLLSYRIELQKGPGGRVPPESEMDRFFEELDRAHKDWLAD